MVIPQLTAPIPVNLGSFLRSRRWKLWLRATIVILLGLLGGAAIGGWEGSALAAVALGGGLLVALALLVSTSLPKAIAADTVVLVGCDSLAFGLKSLLTEESQGSRRGHRARSVCVACTESEADVQVRASRCDLVINAGGARRSWVPPADARGHRPAIAEGTTVLGRLIGRIPLDVAAEDAWLARLGPLRELGWWYRFVKRGLDLAATIVLGVVVLPLIPLVALAIKLNSPGPVFYSQIRVGLGGQLFRIYKFRTMRQDAERDGAAWAQEKDPRITPIGGFLRATRIDELPQIWNVLRGDMTLVGPRPERPEFTTMLESEIPDFAKRHTVRPGLTGWAQVRFCYTNSVKSTRTKLEYDLYYIKHASLGLDAQILLRTILVVVGKRGH